MASSGQAYMRGLSMIGETDAGVGVGPSFVPKVSEQVEKMLPEFSSFASAVGRLLQDLRTAVAG